MIQVNMSSPHTLVRGPRRWAAKWAIISTDNKLIIKHSGMEKTMLCCLGLGRRATNPPIKTVKQN